MATITKRVLNEVVNQEVNRLMVEAYQRKDIKTLQEIYVYKYGKLDEGFGDFVKGIGRGIAKGVKAVGRGVKAVGGFFTDYYQGIKDIGISKDSAGLLMGGKHVLSFKKRQAMRGEARQQLENTLKTLNFPKLTELNYELDKVYEFPNTGNPEAFKEAVKKIDDFYAKVVADHSSGKVKAKTANSIIGSMRQMVNFYADFRLNEKGIYKSGQVREGLKLKLREEYEEVGDVEGSAEGEGPKNAEIYGKPPKGLIMIGASLAGLGFISSTLAVGRFLNGLKDMVTTTTPDITTIVDTIGRRVKIREGEGIWKTWERISGTRIDPNMKIDALNAQPGWPEFLEQVKEHALLHPSRGKPAIDAILGGSYNGQTVGQVFSGDLSGIGSSALGVSPAAWDEHIRTTVVTAGRTVTEEADTLNNTVINFITSAAFKSALTTLGYGALAAGLIIWAMRKKGSKDSRLATLLALVQRMKNVQDAAQGQEQPGQPTAQQPAAEQPAAAQQPAAKGGSKTLIKPEEFMSGTGEFGEQGREVLNFYKRQLPDVQPDVIEKTVGWLVRNNRMLSEMLKKANARLLTEGVATRYVLSKSFKVLLNEVMVKNDQGIYVPQVSKSNYSSGQDPRTSRATGLGSRGVFSAQAGADNFGAKTNNPAGKADPSSIKMQHPIWRVLAAYVRRDTGIKDLTQIEKVINMVVKNQKMASHPEDNQEAQELDASKANQVKIPGNKTAAPAQQPAAQQPAAEKPATPAPAAAQTSTAPQAEPKKSSMFDIDPGEEARLKKAADQKMNRSRMEEVKRLQQLAGIKKK